MVSYKLDIHEENPCKVLLKFLIPKEDVIEETEKAYAEIYKVAKVPGFRTGKVPLQIVKERFYERAKEKVVENILKETVFKAVKEKKLFPAVYPYVKDIKFDFNTPMEFTVVVEQHPEFKIKNYTGLKIKKEIKKVKEEDISRVIKQLQNYNMKLVESKGTTVQKDSFVNISYKVYLEDKLIPELSEENQLIDMGADYIISGIKEAIIGLKAGEEKNTNITLPASFIKKQYAGKNINLVIKVNSIKDKELPEINDEFAKDIGYNSIKELEEEIKKKLESENERTAEEKLEQQIIDILIKENNIQFLPESLVKEQENFLIEQTVKNCLINGWQEDKIKEYINNNISKFEEEAKRSIKLRYIFDKIAEQEKIEVEPEEVREEIEKMKTNYPDKKEEIEKKFEEKENIYKLTLQLKTDKILKFIKEKANIKIVFVN